jgi:Phosphate acetyl/butaryl transferase
MEGKATLFKRFADIDVFDLELNASDPEEVVRIVKGLEPTFGGINLEDTSWRSRIGCCSAPIRWSTSSRAPRSWPRSRSWPADTARFFDVEPRIALLSFSNFGSARHPSAERVALAARLARQRRPDLVIDGELNVETALVEEVAREHFPHSQIQGDANVLIFPDLAAGNIGYKIAHRLGKADMVGPILMGMRRPVNVLPPGATAADIVNVTAITAVAAEMETETLPAPVTLIEHAGV